MEDYIVQTLKQYLLDKCRSIPEFSGISVIKNKKTKEKEIVIYFISKCNHQIPPRYNDLKVNIRYICE